jgi:NAD(P)-dependent dehydrogenase (short-subunit alcohol dehydrogenase family)
MESTILDLFSLKGRVALVVGGNRGLGLSMAKALAEAGATIAIAARDETKNREAAAFIRRIYPKAAPGGETAAGYCLSVECDVCKADSIASAVSQVVAQAGKIDILINSAGINIRGPIEQLSPEDFNKVQQVNVTGSWLAAREVVPIMKANGYGRIINIGSMLSVIAIPERTPYATSKGAILQLTRSLAIELARDSINVNAILPGPFATDMNLPLLEDPAKYQAFISKVPMGRWGDLHEIGGIALYLASPASSYTTGACISVDGGWVSQ